MTTSRKKRKKYRGFATAEESLRDMIIGSPEPTIISDEEECKNHCINIGGSCMNCGRDMSVPDIRDIRKELRRRQSMEK